MFLSMLIGLATEVDVAGLGSCASGLWLMESPFWKAVKPQHGTQVVGEACSPGAGTWEIPQAPPFSAIRHTWSTCCVQVPGSCGGVESQTGHGRALQEHGLLGGMEAFIQIYSVKPTKRSMNMC